MKQINFIKTVSPEEQRAMHHWFWFTCSLFFIIITSAIIMYCNQSTTLRSLQKEYQALAPATQQLETYITEKRQLKVKEETLKDKVAKMRRIKETPKNPAPLLHVLIQTLPQDIFLQRMSLKKKHATMLFVGSTSQSILAYLAQLKKHDLFSRIELRTMEHAGNSIKTSVEATLN